MANISYASTGNKKDHISTFISSESFSNILPIKQLLEDDWQQAPAKRSSIAFTQNEIGVSAQWHNATFTVAQRLDYFLYTNSDTANAFYLERTNQALTTQNSYQLTLKLHHQRSNGFKLGYQWQFNNLSTEIHLGYWDVSATRESQITGKIFGDEQNNITGTAQLDEFYSNKNFLKRDKFDRWDVNGYGITLDISAKWQVTKKLALALDIQDLYSQFKMENLGYSQGSVDTAGTFINHLGGKSYLPLYQGIETSRNYQFNLPEQINFVARYQQSTLSPEYMTVNYLARYKRQGNVNFYYAGIELEFDNSALKLMLDLENMSPEIQYNNQWFTLIFALDDLNIDKAMQINLGIAFNYTF